jgi:hypothetical protein
MSDFSIDEFKKILSETNNFSSFENNIRKIENNKIKGDVFEIFANEYINKFIQEISIDLNSFGTFDFKKYVRFSDLTDIEKDLTDLEINDCGVDGIIFLKNKKFSFVQVKFRDRDNLNWTELSTFLGMCYGLDNLHVPILITNCQTIPSPLIKRKVKVINNFNNATHKFWNKLKKEYGLIENKKEIEINLEISDNVKTDQPITQSSNTINPLFTMSVDDILKIDDKSRKITLRHLKEYLKSKNIKGFTNSKKEALDKIKDINKQ